MGATSIHALNEKPPKTEEDMAISAEGWKTMRGADRAGDPPLAYLSIVPHRTPSLLFGMLLACLPGHVYRARIAMCQELICDAVRSWGRGAFGQE